MIVDQPLNTCKFSLHRVIHYNLLKTAKPESTPVWAREHVLIGAATGETKPARFAPARDLQRFWLVRAGA